MRYLILSLFFLLSACNLISPATPTPSPVRTPPAPTLTAPTASTPPLAPTGTPPVAASTAPSAPTASGGPGAAAGVDTAAFAADLRPEFQGDTALISSPTIYRMDLSLSPGFGTLAGSQAVTYTNRTGQPLNEIYFRLFANYPDGGDKIAVDNVQVNGAPAQTSMQVQDTALKVTLPEPLAPGSQTRLDLKWSVTIPVSSTEHYADFTNSDGIITLPSVYPLIPAHDDNGWHIELPPAFGDLVNAEASFYDVRITAPATTTVIASGSAVEQTTQGNSKTWHYIGAPMRDFSIDASAVLNKASLQVGDITVNSYYLAQDETVGKLVLKWSADAVATYERRIGPYPFQELDVLETPNQAGGIEYPGLVVLPIRNYRNPGQRNILEFATAHEVAHQWFYSVVGDDQVNTPWMDESLVNYVTFIYEQDVHGKGIADFIKQNIFQAPFDEAKKQNQDLPIGLPVMSYSEDQYGAIVYGKGPLFFDAVRQQMGDDKFFQFLSTYYTRERYKLARPEDMLKTMNEIGGQDFTALFNQWVYGK